MFTLNIFDVYFPLGLYTFLFTYWKVCSLFYYHKIAMMNCMHAYKSDEFLGFKQIKLEDTTLK